MKEIRPQTRISKREMIKLSGLAASGVFILPVLQKLQFRESELSSNITDKLLEPFFTESEKRRNQRSENEPEYSKIIDWELNSNRVNFLFFAYGQTFEPPRVYPETIGSHTIYSYDLNRKVVDLVSITHDTRAPEIERFLTSKTGQKTGPIKIDRAYGTAGGGSDGFDLQRQVLESATGLSVDFQVVMDDSFIVDLVDRVFGKIKINSPKAFRVNPFYYQGKLYPEGEFVEGIQEIDGRQAIQFIKSVVIEKDKNYPDPDLEHNARKPIIINGISEQARQNLFNPFFYQKCIDFTNKAIRRKQLESDFSPSLFLDNMAGFMFNVFKSPFDNTDLSFPPNVGKNVYIVNWTQGAGGVVWAKSDDNPITMNDFYQGIYVDQSFEVPLNANPYAKNLAEEYWQSVRKKVKSLIY
ncbi:MAG: LCP family protein [Candidatus Levybacteria bacterium]|nr:LCP family protein [Candidatus Levybacteria bacterium]